jgi:hypothetical protein
MMKENARYTGVFKKSGSKPNLYQLTTKYKHQMIAPPSTFQIDIFWPYFAMILVEERRDPDSYINTCRYVEQ